MSRSALRIGDNLSTPAAKRSFNRTMFDEIAPRYDFITRGLSFWRDAAWKRHLIHLLPVLHMPTCIDLACGTGDITRLLAQRYRSGTITGYDISDEMLRRANRRTLPNLHFTHGDMQAIAAPDNAVDIVTGGYALRNAPHLPATLAEIYRVLKPGGVAAFLDFSKPVTPFKQAIEYRILKAWTSLWGLALHRNAQVYNYIAESLRLYPDRMVLKHMLEQQGFIIRTSQLNFFGITEILVVQKPATNG